MASFEEMKFGISVKCHCQENLAGQNIGTQSMQEVFFW